MVIFFDIDGTIIDNDTQIIPPSAVRAVKKLKENGHLAVVNTGRPYTHIDPRVREMEFGGWVCGCGMEILLDGQWLVRRMPDADACRQVRDAVRECRMQVLYESREGAILTDGELSRHPRLVEEADRMRQKDFRVEELDDQPELRFMKLVTYDGPDSRREEFIRRVSPWYDCIDRGDTMLELVLRGCTKAGGMLELLRHLNIPKEQAVAIGDSTNDLPMFAVAGHSICLGDGMEELKAQAEYITAPVLQDGLEKGLAHYGLL